MKFLILFSALILQVAQAQTFWGEKKSLGNGHAASFIKTYKGKPLEIGMAISADALTNLPHTMLELTLPLPKEVSIKPYQHLTLDWNPHGHEPGGVYDKPHFDFHFYMISEGERECITCTDEDAANCHQQPHADYLVDQYAPTPAGVPKMGWHWVDLLAPEFNGGIFSRTFIYGYYKGLPIFLEPMVTLEFLQSKVTTEHEIRMPLRFAAEDGQYPAGYKITYDKKLKMHLVILKDFQDEGP